MVYAKLIHDLPHLFLVPRVELYLVHVFPHVYVYHQERLIAILPHVVKLLHRRFSLGLPVVAYLTAHAVGWVLNGRNSVGGFVGAFLFCFFSWIVGFSSFKELILELPLLSAECHPSNGFIHVLRIMDTLVGIFLNFIEPLFFFALVMLGVLSGRLWNLIIADARMMVMIILSLTMLFIYFWKMWDFVDAIGAFVEIVGIFCD